MATWVVILRQASTFFKICEKILGEILQNPVRISIIKRCRSVDLRDLAAHAIACEALEPLNVALFQSSMVRHQQRDRPLAHLQPQLATLVAHAMEAH